MIRRILTACLLAALPMLAFADGPTKAELEGRNLAKELIEQPPAGNSALTGVLRIRHSKSRSSEVPVRCRIASTETNWQTIYETLPGTNSITEKLIVTHGGIPQCGTNRYELNGVVVLNAKAGVPFAGSDFWVADLGLEFLHWPAQRVLKKELRRSRGCTVLESTNPEPSPGSYARVVSWIDRETGGIIHADAYDARNKRLKEFEPKEFKKVNGQWQLQEMQIRNVQTGSRTQLEFDLAGKP